MKKIYLLLLIICSVCAFTACSDDDENPGGYCPVANYAVPPIGYFNATLNIAGVGFDETSRFYLVSTTNVETAIGESTVSLIGASFVIPDDLAAGRYSVVLKQNGVWNLGNIELTTEDQIFVTVTDMPSTAAAGEEITISGTNFNSDCRIYFESDDAIEDAEVIEATEGGITVAVPITLPGGDFKVMLAQGKFQLGTMHITEKTGPWQLSKITISGADDYSATSTLAYDEAGRLSEFYDGDADATYTFRYDSDEEVVVTKEYAFDPDYTQDPVTYTFTLADGKVISSISDEEGETYEWTYAGNYLQSIDKELDTIRYAYDGGNIGSYTHITIYQYGDDEPDERMEDVLTYTYAKPYDNNAGSVDVMAIIQQKITYRTDEYLARLAGLCGAKPAQLPTSTAGSSENTFSYEVHEKGYITRILMNENDEYGAMTYRLSYK